MILIVRRKPAVARRHVRGFKQRHRLPLIRPVLQIAAQQKAVRPRVKLTARKRLARCFCRRTADGGRVVPWACLLAGVVIAEEMNHIWRRRSLLRWWLQSCRDVACAVGSVDVLPFVVIVKAVGRHFEADLQPGLVDASISGRRLCVAC
jgi:hypothetical protein